MDNAFILQQVIGKIIAIGTGVQVFINQENASETISRLELWKVLHIIFRRLLELIILLLFYS